MSTEKTVIDSPGEAFSVLVQAAELGQSKGIFELRDSALIYQAIEFIKAMATPKTDEQTVNG